MADPQYNFDGIADVKPPYQGRNVLAEGRASLAQQQQGDEPDSPLMASLGPLAHPETLTDFARLLTLPVDTVRRALGAVSAASAARDLRSQAAGAVRDTTASGLRIAGKVVEKPIREHASDALTGLANRVQRPSVAPVAEPVASTPVAPAPPTAEVARTAAPQSLAEYGPHPNRSPTWIRSEDMLARKRAEYQARQAPPAETAAKPMLLASETKEYVRLIKTGKSSREALELIQAQRALNESLGLTTPTAAQTRFPKGMRDLGATKPLGGLE